MLKDKVNYTKVKTVELIVNGATLKVYINHPVVMPEEKAKEIAISIIKEQYGNNLSEFHKYGLKASHQHVTVGNPKNCKGIFLKDF